MQIKTIFFFIRFSLQFVCPASRAPGLVLSEAGEERADHISLFFFLRSGIQSVQVSLSGGEVGNVTVADHLNSLSGNGDVKPVGNAFQVGNGNAGANSNTRANSDANSEGA